MVIVLNSIRFVGFEEMLLFLHKISYRFFRNVFHRNFVIFRNIVFLKTRKKNIILKDKFHSNRKCNNEPNEFSTHAVTWFKYVRCELFANSNSCSCLLSISVRWLSSILKFDSWFSGCSQDVWLKIIQPLSVCRL